MTHSRRADLRPPQTPTPDALGAAFERSEGLTVGLEEELLLLDPHTFEPAPLAAEVLERLGDEQRFRPELPAAQLEIVTAPREGLSDAIADLARGRAEVLRAGDGLRAASIPVHPFASPVAELSGGAHYERVREQFGPVAELQLVSSLHVHVAAGGAGRSLAVHDALRSYLPELAALAACGPFHDGRDSGLASIRPKIADLLPRQGVPPAFGSWRGYAAAMRWSAAAEAVPTPRYWWYELRLNPRFGTVEVRVADAQARLVDQAAIAAVALGLVAMLCERHDAGELPPVAATHRIEENRWSAIRDGIEGTMADLETGARRPTRERLSGLLDSIEPYCERLRCETELSGARALVDTNGAIELRAIAAEAGGDLVASTRSLADGFEEGVPSLD